MSCWQDEIHHYLKISLLNMVIIAAKRGKYFLETFLKFSEIMDDHDEMHISHPCYVAGWKNY